MGTTLPQPSSTSRTSSQSPSSPPSSGAAGVTGVRDWVVAALTLSLVGISSYAADPAAPPWLASERGSIGDGNHISHLGWENLGLDAIGQLTELAQQGSNPVAAMPSRQAGAALLVALFLWASVGPRGRAALLAYAFLMALTLVYTGRARRRRRCRGLAGRYGCSGRRGRDAPTA